MNYPLFTEEQKKQANKLVPLAYMISLSKTGGMPENKMKEKIYPTFLKVLRNKVDERLIEN